MSSGEQALGPSGAVIIGAATALYAAVTAYLLFGVDRADALAICLCAGLLVLSYAVAVRALPLRAALGIGLALRVAAVFAWPALSDDVYRFLWDGELWLAGIHPLDAPPSALADAGAAGAAFAKTHSDLLGAMNSPNYYTVYPPLAQTVFAAAVYLGRDPAMSVMLMKVVLLTAEGGTLFLIYALTRTAGPLPTTAYALHPLPIVELVGNAHFEAIAVCGVLGAVYWLRWAGASQTHGVLALRHYALGGVSLALGALAKLVPLLFAPALFFAALWRGEREPRWRGGLTAASACALVLAGGFAFFFAGADVGGFGDSLDLYFRSFEFNGSLYALARGIGWWYRGWNWIAVVGPALALLGVVGVLALSLTRGYRGAAEAETLLWCAAVYLLCATTVHPWYFAYLVALGCLTPYRWPLLLGLTSLLSYVAYAQELIAVPGWALALEYLPPALLAVFEVRRRGNSVGGVKRTFAR